MGHSNHKDGDGKFRTRDLPLAAFLSLHGHEHVSMERRGRVGYWVFLRNDDLDSLIRSYGEGEVCLNVKDYLDCVHDVRSSLYSYLGIA